MKSKWCGTSAACCYAYLLVFCAVFCVRFKSENFHNIHFTAIFRLWSTTLQYFSFEPVNPLMLCHKNIFLQYECHCYCHLHCYWFLEFFGVIIVYNDLRLTILHWNCIPQHDDDDDDDDHYHHHHYYLRFNLKPQHSLFKLCQPMSWQRFCHDEMSFTSSVNDISLTAQCLMNQSYHFKKRKLHVSVVD